MSFLSLSAVVSRVWNELNTGYTTDDSRFNTSIIQDEILAVRAKLIAERFKIEPIPAIYNQRCCVDLACRPVCNSPVSEWTADIPDLLGTLGIKGLSYVGSPDGDKKIEYKPYQVVNTKNSSYLPYPKNKVDNPFFTVVGNELTVFNKPTGLTKLMLIGVFANPYHCNCDIEGEMIIPADHITDLVKGVIFSLSGYILDKKLDKRNDTNPE